MSKLPALMDYIDGQWVEPAVALDQWIHDPNTAEPIHQQRATHPEQVAQAVQTAWQLHQSGVWANTSVAERAEKLEQAAQVAQEMIAEIAQVESATTGVVVNLSQMVCQIVHLAFTAAAGQLRTGWMDSTMAGPHGAVEILRRPWGPAACIVPWNAPAALAAHKVANALAAGCPTILKPSEWAPHSCLFLGRILEKVDLPQGLFQIINGGGAVGAQLVSDVRIRAVSFTGGLHGGRAVAQACAYDLKPAQLELGGNNAMIVLEDADIEAAANGVVAGLTTLNGQWCRALGRLLVHEKVYSEVLEASLAKLASIRVGHSLATDSQMGPLVHAGHKHVIETAVSRLQAAGGQSHQSTPLPDELAGYFFAPTLITDVASENTIEEVFGPVAAVHTFKTDAEAVRLANETPYGLGGYVFGQDEERALALARQMNTGGVKINGVSLMSLNHMAARPAWGLSGLGEEGTAETFQFFCGTRVVGVAG